MKEYTIDKSVKLNNQITSNNNFFEKLKEKVKKIPPVIVSPIPTLMYEYLKNVETNKITSTEQLSKFITQGKWSHDVTYVGHPIFSNVLIPKKEYSDVLLHEIVADISSYILDNISVKELTFGCVSESNTKGNVSFPVKEIAVNAKCDCNISNSYYFHIEESQCQNQKQNHVWIDYFPEIKSAVEHKSAFMENIFEKNLGFSLDVGLADTIKGAFNYNKNMKFYINFKKL